MAQFPARHRGAALPILLAAVAAAFAMLAFWTPLMQDDLVFMAQAADRSADPAAFTPAAWLDHAALMYAENNGRLANILAPLGAWLLPAWGRALLIGLCAAWIFFIAARMVSGGGRASWRVVALMFALSLAAWPWRDRLMFWDYALNYLFASALLLPVLYLFCKGKPGWRPVAAGALCGFFGAWLHDGSALCMLAAVGALVITRRACLTRPRWIMGISLALGTVAVLASPGEWQRASGELGSNSLAYNLLVSLAIEPLAWVLAAATIGVIVWRSPRAKAFAARLFVDNIFLGCSFMALFSTLMSIMLDPSGRYGWQAGVFASVALFRLWRDAGVSLPRGVVRAVVCGALCVAAVVMVNAISFQRRLWIENVEILSEARSSDCGTVFRDLLTTADEPLTALRIPATGIWQSAFQMACANALSHPDSPRMTAVVPSALASLSEIPTADTLFISEGYLLGTDTVAPFSEPGFLCGAQRSAVVELLLTDSAGVTRSATFWPYKFRHPALGGRALVFYGSVPLSTVAASAED